MNTTEETTLRDSMTDFMRRTGAFQDARNIAVIRQPASASSITEKRTTTVPARQFDRPSSSRTSVEKPVEGGGDGSSITGSFHRQFKTDGRYMLQGGQVTSNTGNVVVPDITMTAATTPSVNDRVVYLKVGVKPVILSNRIYGMKVTSAVAVTNAILPLPSNTLPVVTAPDDESFVYILLGQWTDGKFYTSLPPGGFAITYCNTGYTITGLPYG